jgi:hypothetical protein
MNRLQRLSQVALLALVGSALAGCASLNIGSYSSRLDVAAYRTYAWGPADLVTTGDPRLDNNPFFAERLRMEVEKALAMKGFAKTTTEAPQLLLHYHASVTQELNLNGIDGQNYSDDGPRPFIYEMGTIVVDLVDPRTKALLWRGWAEGAIDSVIDNQAWMEERIDQAVARIMERLPGRL